MYDACHVDALLERIAADVDAGRSVGPLIVGATFPVLRRRETRRGCDVGAVEWFLEQLRQRENPAEAADPWRDLAADPYTVRRDSSFPGGRVAAPSKEECTDAWCDFNRPPGTRLALCGTGPWRGELRTITGQTILTARTGPHTTSLSLGGRTYIQRRVTRSSWPDIAPTISHTLPTAPAHQLERYTESRINLRWRYLDETGRPILYATNSHGYHYACGYIKFPGQRWLRFPVRSTRRANAIMTALDQDGHKVARYRITPYTAVMHRMIEITIHPDQQLTTELALAIAISAPWIRSYFKEHSAAA